MSHTIKEDSIDSLVINTYIERAVKGEQEAFTWLYKNYSKKVYFLALQFFKSESIAEDIVQEVFLQVHKKIHTLQSVNAFNSWLHTITYHTCVDYKRGKIILTQFENNNDNELLIEDTNPNVSDYLEYQRIQTIIVETLDDMKLPLRIVGQLKFLEDMKNVEIAEILNISKVTVSKRIKTIKEKLQKSLERNGITNSTYGVMVISPAIVSETYQMIFNNCVMNEGASIRILGNVLKGNIKVVGKQTISHLIKQVIGITLTLSGGFIFWFMTQKNDIKPLVPLITLPPIVEESAQITDILYDTQWQYTSINLDVKTTTDNYDAITINDIETLMISNNGTYTVKLIDNGKVVDQKDITISNIDRNSPKAQSEKDDNNYYFYVTDDLSGVNWDSIRYIKNGVTSTDYTYNKDENVITITNDGVSKHEIYISDTAGNLCEIHIK